MQIQASIQGFGELANYHNYRQYLNMHIAYSAVNGNQNLALPTSDDVKRDKRLQARYKGYKAACKKYKHEIMAIQQFLPDWQPQFK